MSSPPNAQYTHLKPVHGVREAAKNVCAARIAATAALVRARRWSLSLRFSVPTVKAAGQNRSDLTIRVMSVVVVAGGFAISRLVMINLSKAPIRLCFE
jgi:hypothetical protein